MWKPTQDFVVRLADKTAEQRKEKDLEQMVSEMKVTANKYGFDLLQYGSWEGMKKTAIGEAEILDQKK